MRSKIAPTQNDLIGLIKREMKVDLPLEPDTPLLSSGIINSFEVVQLLFFLENHFNVSIDPADVGVDSFDTVEQISEYLGLRR